MQTGSWASSRRKSRFNKPAVFFSNLRDPLVALTSALALTATCGTAGLAWATVLHPESRATVGIVQPAATRSTSIPLGRPSGVLVTLVGANDHSSASGPRAARVKTPTNGRLQPTATPDDTPLPPSPPRPVTSDPRAAHEIAPPPEDESLEDAQEGSPVRDAVESTRGGRPYGELDTRSDPSVIDSESRLGVPVVLHENGLEAEFRTTNVALGDALRAAGVVLQEGDSVSPALETPVNPGLHVYVRHSFGIDLEIGGTAEQFRTLAGTVREALNEHGILIGGDDRVEPALDTPVQAGMQISLVRVERELITEQEVLDFQVERRPDPDMEIGQQRIDPGQEGLRQRQIEVVRENGEEVSRTVAREWMEAEPKIGVEYYGTKLVVRELDTPDGGELHYTRTMSVYATWYNASHGGKPRSSPWYGITAIGMRAGRGVVAVDPSVIPLRTRMYIPGYGIAVAGDTGGAVRGAHVDLGFDEDEVSPWRSGWITIYILE